MIDSATVSPLSFASLSLSHLFCKFIEGTSNSHACVEEVKMVGKLLKVQ